MERIPGISFRACAVGIRAQNIWEVSMQGAPVVHVHELQPAANAQTRKPKGIHCMQECAFDGVSFEVNGATPCGVCGLTIPGGVDVCTARHQHAVGSFQGLRSILQKRQFRSIVPVDDIRRC